MDLKDLNILLFKMIKKIVDKILIGTNKMDKSDNKITLCKIKFDLAA